MSVSAIDVWTKVARIPSIKSAYFKNDLIFANLEISLVSFKKLMFRPKPYYSILYASYYMVHIKWFITYGKPKIEIR